MLVQIALGLVATLSGLIPNQTDVVNTEQAYEEEHAALSPQEYLQRLAGPDFELLNRIVICESGWKPTAQNSTSSAGGIFQFLDSTWVHYSSSSWNKYDPYKNIDAGIALFKSKGTDPWNASKSCWVTKTTL